MGKAAVPRESAEDVLVRTMAQYMMEPTVEAGLHLKRAMVSYQTVFIAERKREAFPEAITRDKDLRRW